MPVTAPTRRWLAVPRANVVAPRRALLAGLMAPDVAVRPPLSALHRLVTLSPPGRPPPVASLRFLRSASHRRRSMWEPGTMPLMMMHSWPQRR